MNRTVRTILNLGGAAGLAAALAACGPDDSQVNGAKMQTDVQWPLEAYGFADPGQRGGNTLPPLPEAEPMVHRAVATSSSSTTYSSGSGRTSGGYGYAPEYYDEAYSRDDDEPGYYEDAPSDDSYALLGLAAVLGGVLADAPPDYGFSYGEAQPWAWETGDRYRRYAEPITDGYRYYYYAPDADYPFLVSDPYYSYGYRQDRLAAIYDRDGRVVDPQRAMRQRRIADTYYTRGYDLYRASRAERHIGVAAPLWDQRRPDIERSQAVWERARNETPRWQEWDRRHDDVITARWTQERAVRRYAADRFSSWRAADYRGEAPRFYREAAQDKGLRKAVLARQARLYRQAAVDQHRQAQAQQVRQQQQVRQVQAQRAHQLQQVRQAQAQRVRQQQQVRQVQAQRVRQQQQVRQVQAQQVRQQQQVRQAQAQRVRQQQQVRQAQAQRVRQQQQVRQAQAQQVRQQQQVRQAQAQRVRQQQQVRQAQAQQAHQQQARQVQARSPHQQLQARAVQPHPGRGVDHD